MAGALPFFGRARLPRPNLRGIDISSERQRHGISHSENNLNGRQEKMQKALDKAGKNVYNIRNLRENAIGISQEYLEKYSRGRRGAPAKGVGRLYRRESSNLSFSASGKLPLPAIGECIAMLCFIPRCLRGQRKKFKYKRKSPYFTVIWREIRAFSMLISPVKPCFCPFCY